MTKNSLKLLACLPLIVAGAAIAQTGQEAEHGTDAPAFELLDTDRDGAISKTEAQRLTGLEEVFAKADGNQDGVLDRFEYREAIAHLRG